MIPKNNPQQPRHEAVSKAVQASGKDFSTTWWIDYFTLFAFSLNTKDPGIMNQCPREPNVILGQGSSLHSASHPNISNYYTIKATEVNKAAKKSTDHIQHIQQGVNKYSQKTASNNNPNLLVFSAYQEQINEAKSGPGSQYQFITGANFLPTRGLHKKWCFQK